MNWRLLAWGLFLEALALVPLPLSLSSKLAWSTSLVLDGVLVSSGLVLAVSGLFTGTEMSVQAASRLAVASFILGVVFMFVVVQSYISYTEALNACSGLPSLNYQDLTRCDQVSGFLYYTWFYSASILVSMLIFLKSVFFLNRNPQAEQISLRNHESPPVVRNAIEVMRLGWTKQTVRGSSGKNGSIIGVGPGCDSHD